LYPTFTNTKCNFNNGTASVFASAGLALFTYLWGGGQTVSAVANLAPGSYNVTVTDALACVKSYTFTISASPPMTISVVFKNASCDTTNGYINLTLANTTNPVQYVWSNGDTTKNVVNLGDGIYTVTATDINGCVSTKTVTILDDGKPNALIINYIPPLCAGDSTGILTLVGYNGVGPYKYSLDGVNFVTSPTLTNVAAGSYTLLVKDANSCLNDTTITLIDGTPITISYLPYDTLICYTDVISNLVIQTVGGYPAYQYKLDNSEYYNTNQLQNIGIGNHILYIKDSIGCIKPFPINVYGPDTILYASAIQKDVACFRINEGYLQTTIKGGWQPYTWQWADGKTNLFRDSLTKGKYILNITDSKGCKVNQPFEILQRYCCEVYLPNAFSPNGDSHNDYLYIIPRADVSEVQWMIVDRWGAKLFETKDISQKWDGTYGGKPMPLETYFYYLKYKCSFDENYYYLKGEFLLVR
jgi:large repetitive protein